MKLKRIATALLIVLLALSLSGSSSTCSKKKEEKRIQEMSAELCEAANQFNYLLVWKNYDLASLMVVPSRRVDFLVDAEKFAGALQIENFAVVVCQVEETPPVRKIDLPDTTEPEKKDDAAAKEKQDAERQHIGKDEAVEAVEKRNLSPEQANALHEAGIERPSPKKPKKDRVYYGTVLVRYINRSILPSATVDTKLIKQYWVSVGEVWYCDFEWPELFKR